MGWEGEFGTVQDIAPDIVQRTTQGWENETSITVCLDHVLNEEVWPDGSEYLVLYSVMQTTNRESGEIKKWPLITPMKQDGEHSLWRHYGEDWGPAWIQFPVEWLENLSEPENDDAQWWRDSVRKFARSSR